MRAFLPAVAVLSLVVGGGCGTGGSSSGGGGSAAQLRKTFSFPHVLETSGRAVWVASGDVNGDGVLDLVTIRESPTLHVSLQLATGLRESPSKLSDKHKRGAEAYSPTGSAHVVAWNSLADLGLADMDGDGRLDLVLAGGASQQVGVWRCDPTFRDEFLAPILVDTAGHADRVATGDVNGDGRADLVVLDESTGQAQVFLEASASPMSFSVGPVQPPAVGACHGLALADFDRDGSLDLCTNQEIKDVVVFLDGGAAGFALRESPTRASTGKSMAVGDVDGDGWLDVVVLDEGGKSVTCLHQRPDSPRTFDDVHSPLGIAIDESGVHACTAIAIGDPGVNGNFTQFLDGGSPATSAGSVRVRESPTRQSLGRCDMGLADLDRDGRLDLVCVPAVQDPDPNAAIAYGSRGTSGGFGAVTQRARGIITNIGTGGAPPARIAGIGIADFDSDGHLDCAVCVPENRELLMTYFETGDIPDADQFRQATPIDGSFTIHDQAVADLDRDGRLDLVSATSSGVEIRFCDGVSPCTFSSPTTLLQGVECRCVAVGDVNGDGLPDLVVGAAGNGATLIRNPAVIRGFLPPIPFGTPPPGTSILRSIALADLDGDAHLDVVCIRESPTLPSVQRCQGASNGFFDVFTEIDCGPGNWIHVAAGDLDGDGRMDLAACADAPAACVSSRQGLGVLKFSPPEPVPLMGGVRVAVGDVNGDGRADLVTAGTGGARVALQSHDVTGRFLASYGLESEACGGLALGDVDRDGHTDIAFTKVGAGTLEVVHGDPDFDLLRLSLNGLPPGTPVLGMIILEADTDGDGLDEIIVGCPKTVGATTGTIRMFTRSP